MKEVEHKWSTLKLNDDIWAKLIYFEQNRRLAKAYVSTPVLTIDGSTNGLDGFRIGLSGIENPYRNLDSISSLRSIGPGIKLKIDHQGNIVIRRVRPNNSSATKNNHNNNNNNNNNNNVENINNANGHRDVERSGVRRQYSGDKLNGAKLSGSMGLPLPPPPPQQSQCSVWVKDWPLRDSLDRTNSSQFGDDGAIVRELGTHTDASYTLFDMRKFRIQLEKRKLNNDYSALDWRSCVTLISLVSNNDNLKFRRGQQQAGSSRDDFDQMLDEPCWLMLINIIAIDMLKSYDRQQGFSLGIGRAFIGRNPRSSRPPLNNLDESLYHYQQQQQKRPLEQRNQMSITNEPLRTSSSASVLYPASNASSSNYKTSTANDLRDSVFNRSPEASGEERSRKNRSGNSNELDGHRYKPSMLSNHRSSANYRDYQSTQHLSSNQAIYTTFNYPYRTNNSRSNVDNWSSSGYNSVSHSSASGYRQSWYQRQPQQHYLEPVNSFSEQEARLKYYSRRESAVLSGFDYSATNETTIPTRPYSSVLSRRESKKLSLSVHELTQRRNPPSNFKLLHSAIKMNYDDANEQGNAISDHHLSDDSAVSSNENQTNANGTSPRESTSPASGLVSDSTAVVNGSGGILKKNSQSKICDKRETSDVCEEDENDDYKTADERRLKNHKDHSVAQGETGQVINSTGGEKQKLQYAKLKQKHQPLEQLEQQQQLSQQPQQQPQQQVSRSSLASSSSSSGCADNDYFISNSSSSMSSSTGSNERESFSQPTSSSGIVCLGSASDEYDDIQKSSASKSLEANLGSSEAKDFANINKPQTMRSPNSLLKDEFKSVHIKKNKNHEIAKNVDPLALGCYDCATKGSSFECQLDNRGLIVHQEGGDIDKADYEPNCDCDCAPVDYTPCDCCECNGLLVPDTESYPDDLIKSKTIACSCSEAESEAYDHLPHPLEISKSFGKSATLGSMTGSTKVAATSVDAATTLSGTSSKSKTGHRNSMYKDKVKRESYRPKKDSVKLDGEEFETKTAPFHRQDRESHLKSSNGNLKSTSSWLERRRYIKIFPRFIFSSPSTSSNGSSSSSNGGNGDRKLNLDSRNMITQEKSGSLQFSRRLGFARSAQNLS